jgi:hypothetical protein
MGNQGPTMYEPAGGVQVQPSNSFRKMALSSDQLCARHRKEKQMGHVQAVKEGPSLWSCGSPAVPGSNSRIPRKAGPCALGRSRATGVSFQILHFRNTRPGSSAHGALPSDQSDGSLKAKIATLAKPHDLPRAGLRLAT